MGLEGNEKQNEMKQNGGHAISNTHQFSTQMYVSNNGVKRPILCW